MDLAGRMTVGKLADEDATSVTILTEDDQRVKLAREELGDLRELQPPTSGCVHIHKSDPRFAGWNYNRNLPLFFISIHDHDFEPRSIFIQFPYWFAILGIGLISVAPWLRWRFNLRMLVIAVTLGAVALGWVIYSQHNYVRRLRTQLVEPDRQVDRSQAQ